MKFRCERDALAEALSTAGRAATGRTGALPVLSGLRLELVGDKLTITGTDLDLTIQLSLTVGGDTDGGVVLPARLAADIVRSLGAGKVEVAVEGEEVSITGGRSQFSVRPLSFDDYPKLAAPTSSSVTLPAAEVGEALRQVVRAASTDEARPILTGVLLTAENGGLRMVATDSYRLAVRDLANHQVLGTDQRVLVPGRALSELQRLVGAGDTLTMRLGDRDATFEVGETRLSTRLIEGEFPNYRQLIPTSHPNTLTVEREPLLEAVRRVKILAKDATPVRLQMGGDTLRLTAITQDVGNASEELDASYEGSDLTVAFNPEYFAAGVEACSSDSVTLSTLDALKPAVVRGVGNDEYLYLLMPVRVP
ncbi:MAG TPA: DNA polymerase III subunit beta [Ilumatobacteraceae bacterium]|nr:DNA polymerase III subunit beta [Ilumatobacteraceae bacterium]